MWTRTNRSGLHGWQPNHFVPFLSKKSNINTGRQSYADVVERGRSVSWRITSGFSTSPPTAKSHNGLSPKSKVQTKPEDQGTSTAYEKNFSSPASVPPTKVTTQAKSFQSATIELKENVAPNSSTSRGRRDDINPRVKIQRKRHHKQEQHQLQS